ncbi:hypothetical protein [Pseudonocardia acaciae]|uniref:hypothetical protein n=1 Tax=Pseudonocardia acaciae TaxID=551276 RepID=UPI0012ECF36D|nr:hypothetical protein [Pseudonocardia acaciae]
MVCAVSLLLAVPSTASASVPVESHPTATSGPVKPNGLKYHVVDTKEIDVPPTPDRYRIDIDSTVTLEEAGRFMFSSSILHGNDPAIILTRHPENNLDGTAGQIVKTTCYLYIDHSRLDNITNDCTIDWNGERITVPFKSFNLPWKGKMQYEIVFWSDR